MIRKDFLDRHLEEFGKVVARLRSLIMKKETEKFEEELQEAFSKYTSVKLQTLQDLSDNDFEMQIVRNTSLLSDEKKKIADLLFEKLHVTMELNNTDADPALKRKCFLLYKEIIENGTQNEYNLDVHYKIKYLELL